MYYILSDAYHIGTFDKAQASSFDVLAPWMWSWKELTFVKLSWHLALGANLKEQLALDKNIDFCI